MKVVDVKTRVLFDPGYDPDATSSAQDTIDLDRGTLEHFAAAATDVVG